VGATACETLGAELERASRGKCSFGLEPQTPPYQETVLRAEGWNRDAAASVLQASRFRGDVTLFRLNSSAAGQIGSKPAFRRNTAERVYRIEAAHNPEVAGSNPAPATAKGARKGAFLRLRGRYGAPSGRLVPSALDFMHAYGQPRAIVTVLWFQ
jgi:hypothetical protein